MKKGLFIILTFFMAWRAEAQQLPVYSQYIYNKFLINPAVAGSDGYTSINLTVREQWVGYAGAPQTYSLSFQTRKLKARWSLKENLFRKTVYRPATDGKVGFGGSIFSDINGLVHRTGFTTSYSYHTWLNGQTQLSFGLAFTGYYYKIDQRNINFDDPDEPWLNTDFRKGMFIPDFHFGTYILNRKFSAGFSAQELLEGLVKVGSQAYKDLSIERTYYIFGNYDFDIDNWNTIEPSILVKMSEQLRPQMDLGLTYVWNNKFWTGLTFRTGSAILANVGVKKDIFFFGYSVDFTLNKIQTTTYGTHEFVVALKFGDSARKFRWLDRY